MTTPHLRRANAGQTLIEILVALAVLVLVLVAIVSRVVDAVASANFARNQVSATRFAQEGLEWARNQRDRLGWQRFSGYVAGNPTFCLPDISIGIDSPSIIVGSCTTSDVIVGTLFTREIGFTTNLSPPPGEGEYTDVTATVSWQDRTGIHVSRLSTRLSRWI